MHRLLGFALVFLMMVAGTGPALAAGYGVISGQVVNKTAGGSPVGTAEITLTTFSNGKSASGQQKATTDAAGRFEFKGLPIDPGTTYAVGTTFQEADYTSSTITLTADNSTQTVELAVYDATTSDENIQISNGHIVAFAGEGALEVLEVWRFNNAGNKTYIGTKGKTTLRFTLPQGAASLSPAQGSIETASNGAVYSAAVPPGVTDISYTYVIPFQGSSVTISRQTDYPIADFHLLVEDTGVKVASKALTPAGPQSINGTNYLDFRAGNLARGVDLDASFSGIARAPVSSEAPLPWLWLLIGVGLLGLMIAIAYPRLKRRQALAGSVAGPAAPLSTLPSPDDENKLLSELAGLDDDYDAGNIEEKKYRARRARTKAQLMEMYNRARRK
ncbi:MAG: carboxypeptidase-like regulatory domain-containing protein [Dehalococcoidales bacterium]|nr:carboxypeptidase-like regulatory domain-containing protein [Dehalococcoidales bacterium]